MNAWRAGLPWDPPTPEEAELAKWMAPGRLQRAVILSKQRCGTDWFQDLLDEGEFSSFEGELLFKECPHDECQLTPEPRVLAPFYQRGAELQAHSNVTLHGFKWMQHQAGFQMTGRGARDEAWARELLNSGFKVLLLTRRVSLAWMVSDLKMKQGSHAHCREGQDGCLAAVRNATVELHGRDAFGVCTSRRPVGTQLAANCSVGEGLRRADANWADVRGWLTRRFPAERLLHVEYEALLKSTRGEMHRVQRFLGRAIHEPAPSAIVRNQHLTLRESVTNYAEVLAQVRGTKWEAEALEEAETSY